MPKSEGEPLLDCRDPRWPGVRYQGRCHPCHMCDTCIREMDARAKRGGWNA